MPAATRSYRIRAYPNPAQRRMLDRWFGASRWLWNTALAIRGEGYTHCGLKLSGTDISRWLTQWKCTPGHEWLRQVPATWLTQMLRDQDRAFANFFARRTRYPRFKPGEFRRQLTSKAGWYGRTVIACDRFFASSKLCSKCGHKLDELRLDVRQWTCPKCGTNHDRDINAAQNLLTVGIQELGPYDGDELRAEAEDPCTAVMPAPMSAAEARSGQITANGTEREHVS